jgi:hypothetical protein
MTSHHSTRRVQSLILRAALVTVIGGTAVQPIAAETEIPPVTHIRTSSPGLAELMRDATARSMTFQQLVDTINGTDGIVYVEEGTCGHSVRACLMLSLAISGPYRLLYVRVNRRNGNWDLQGSIGHELRHVIEVLSSPAVRSSADMYYFYQREGFPRFGTFETDAALHAGDAVRDELRARR